MHAGFPMQSTSLWIKASDMSQAFQSIKTKFSLNKNAFLVTLYFKDQFSLLTSMHITSILAVY